MSTTTKTAGIKLFTLTMLIVVAIDSVRNLPSTALFGGSLIFYSIFSAIVFLIPTALVAADLTARDQTQGGIYHWVRQAFGKHWGFMAIWLQWINTMVWYPTILSFIAATATFLINPHLAQNKFYLVSIILSTFWFLTFINLKGLKISAKFASYCGIIGMVIPMALIIVLAIIWLTLGKPLQLHLTFANMLPTFKSSDSWVSLTAIMTAFLGMELSAVHINKIDNAQQNFPKAMLCSVLIILTTMTFGSLAIAIVLPENQINLVNGVIQAFSNFFAAYHMKWIIPVIVIMLLLGSLGNIINWIISPAKGLLHAAQDGYLPAFLQKENKHGVESNLLLIQAALVSIFCLAFLLMPSVNGSYWLLSDLSTELYMLMYILMFLAAIFLHGKSEMHANAFTIPGGKMGKYMVCLCGLIGCLVTLIVGFFPPGSINVGGVLHYEITFAVGIVLMLIPATLFYMYRNKYNNPALEKNAIVDSLELQ